MSGLAKLYLMLGAILVLASIEQVDNFSSEWWARIIGLAILITIIPGKRKP